MKKGDADLTRRGLLAGGVIAATMLATDAEAAQQHGPERTFEGESKKGDFQEALAAALKHLGAALGEDSVADGSATWKLHSTTGKVGGLVATNHLIVTIATHRTPPWKKA